MALTRLGVNNISNSTIANITALPAAIDVGSLVKLNTTVASNTTSVAFDSSLITSTYNVYQLHCIGCIPATDVQQLRARVSEDNGSSYVSSGVYKKIEFGGVSGSTSSNTIAASYSATSSGIFILGAQQEQGNANNENGSAILTFYTPSSSKAKFFYTVGYEMNSANQATQQQSWYAYDTSSAYNNIKVEYTSGNISTGTFTLYGVTK